MGTFFIIFLQPIFWEFSDFTALLLTVVRGGLKVVAENPSFENIAV